MSINRKNVTCIIKYAIEIFNECTYLDWSGALDWAEYEYEHPEEFEVLTDAQSDRYAIEVQNGEGYYNEDGDFVRYGSYFED